jgi:hypothetical protein
MDRNEAIEFTEVGICVCDSGTIFHAELPDLLQLFLGHPRSFCSEDKSILSAFEDLKELFRPLELLLQLGDLPLVHQSGPTPESDFVLRFRPLTKRTIAAATATTEAQPPSLLPMSWILPIED